MEKMTGNKTAEETTNCNDLLQKGVRYFLRSRRRNDGKKNKTTMAAGYGRGRIKDNGGDGGGGGGGIDVITTNRRTQQLFAQYYRGFGGGSLALFTRTRSIVS